jgi:hypothetical protein
MMKNLLTIFLLLTCGLCFGQNLVPNPSFEDTVSCPVYFHEVPANWHARSNTSPDYFNACSINPDFSVPDNYMGYQPALDGNGYIGLITGNLYNAYHEKIGTQLLQPLVVGTRYYASVYISKAFKIHDADTILCATNKFGMRFSCDPEVPWPFDNIAQVYTDAVVTDTIGWTKISGSFVADSAYQYLLLGNFFDPALTTITLCDNREEPYAYYYADMVCVSSDSVTCPVDFATALRDVKTINEISLSPNPFSNKLSFSIANNEQTTISLYNFLGQQILQQTFTNSTTINTEQLADGIYFYELRSSKGTLKAGKLVKQ